MAISVGTMEDFIENLDSSEGLTITADIDGIQSGYYDVIEKSAGGDIDLNGHTLSNMIFSGGGVFNGKLVSDGRLINMYIGGGTAKLNKVVASVYTTGGFNFVGTTNSIIKSALDVTFSPDVFRAVYNPDAGVKLSNIVFRNAKIKRSAYSTISPFSNSSRWAAFVLDNCVIGDPTDSTAFRFIVNGRSCYFATHNCTYTSGIDMTASVNEQCLFAGDASPYASKDEDLIISEATLRNRQALVEKGFLP